MPQFTFIPSAGAGGGGTADNAIRVLEGGTPNATVYGTIAAAAAAANAGDTLIHSLIR